MQSRIIYIVCYEKFYAWFPAYFETLKLAKEFCIKILDNDPQCGVSIRKAKEFYEFLYSKPGQEIQTMPIRERYWHDEIIKVYKEIDDAEAGSPIVLLTRDEAQSGTHTKTGPAPSRAAPGIDTGTKR